MKYILITTLLMLLACGCTSLPPGDPPAGPIVASNSYLKTFTIQGANNYFITALTAYCLSELPAGTPVSICSASTTNLLPAIYPQHVFAATCQTAQLVATRKKQAAYLLEYNTSGTDPIHWEMRLIRLCDQHIVWSDRVAITSITQTIDQ